MANITINTKPESIIEYTQLENGPDFSYNEKFGTIIIKAGESKWLFRKCKTIKLNKNHHFKKYMFVNGALNGKSIIRIPRNLSFFISMERV